MMFTLKRFFVVAAIAVVPLVLAGCAEESAEEEGEEGTEPAQEQTTSAKNDLLLAASSPFEDLTEFAEAGDAAGMGRAFSDGSERIAKARAELSATERDQLDALLADLDEARKAGDNEAVMLLSIDTYRAIISSLDESALAVPKAVSMLDYVGFKLNAVTGLDEPDWAVIEEVVQEGADLWLSIQGRVTERGLRDAMDTAIEGMQEGLEAQDALMVGFAARVDLDLVDLLEGYFEQGAE